MRLAFMLQDRFIFGCYRSLHSWDTVCTCCCHIEQANLKLCDPQLLHTELELNLLTFELAFAFLFTDDTDQELVVLNISEQTSR